MVPGLAAHLDRRSFRYAGSSSAAALSFCPPAVELYRRSRNDWQREEPMVWAPTDQEIIKKKSIKMRSIILGKYT
jgi:hypothetical protein